MVEIAPNFSAPPARPAPLPPPAVRIRDLGYAARGRILLHKVSLTLAPDGISVLMGPNGAGKSLTLRLIAGLIEPAEGVVERFGHADLDRGRIALVTQNPVVLRRTVRGNLAHALKTYGVPRGQRRGIIDRLLDRGRLADLADRPARVLSGGEKQRLAMVRALAAEPGLLLLDEPTASLDPQSTAAIETLARDAAARGIKVLLVTHDQGQTRRLADDVVFMHAGTVVEHSGADRFFDRPASAEARAYLAGRLLVPADHADDT